MTTYFRLGEFVEFSVLPVSVEFTLLRLSDGLVLSSTFIHSDILTITDFLPSDNPDLSAIFDAEDLCFSYDCSKYAVLGLSLNNIRKFDSSILINHESKSFTVGQKYPNITTTFNYTSVGYSLGYYDGYINASESVPYDCDLPDGVTDTPATPSSCCGSLSLVTVPAIVTGKQIGRAHV